MQLGGPYECQALVVLNLHVGISWDPKSNRVSREGVLEET